MINFDKTIQVYTKNVYGNTLIYPACDNAKNFIQLLDNITFQKWQLEIIKSLGFKVEQVINPEEKL